MRLLHIDSSILGEASVTRQIGRGVVEQWRQRSPGLDVTYRDLAVNPPGHLSAELLGARQAAPASLTPAQRAEVELGETLLAEFLAADVIVLGAPMYNFSIPTQLKAWLDRVLVAGRTFRYTESGPVGLAGGKQVVIVSSRGGVYSEGPAQTMDHQESYLKAALSLAGITDVGVIRAEAVNMGAERRENAIAAALEQVRGLSKKAA